MSLAADAILRRDFVVEALAHLGAPVLWGAKGPDVFDCSGLVTWCLARVGGPDWKTTHNTDRLWAECPLGNDHQPGDLAFWYSKAEDAAAKGDVEHVAICLAGGHILTADGATSHIMSLEGAKASGARVRVRETVHYRPRFAGYRRFPLEVDEDGKPVLARRT